MYAVIKIDHDNSDIEITPVYWGISDIQEAEKLRIEALDTWNSIPEFNQNPNLLQVIQY